MMISKHWYARVLANVALTVPLFSILYVGFLALQRVHYPTDVSAVTLTTPGPYRAGDILAVTFNVRRYKTCLLNISRVIERQADHREFEMGFIQQVIEEDDPPIERLSGYRVQIPPELTPGQYVIFSRFRYYCTGLDMWWPWVRRTENVPITVVP